MVGSWEVAPDRLHERGPMRLWPGVPTGMHCHCWTGRGWGNAVTERWGFARGVNIFRRVPFLSRLSWFDSLVRRCSAARATRAPFPPLEDSSLLPRLNRSMTLFKGVQATFFKKYSVDKAAHLHILRTEVQPRYRPGPRRWERKTQQLFAHTLAAKYTHPRPPAKVLFWSRGPPTHPHPPHHGQPAPLSPA